jgi:hypothetical protein
VIFPGSTYSGHLCSFAYRFIQEKRDVSSVLEHYSSMVESPGETTASVSIELALAGGRSRFKEM